MSEKKLKISLDFDDRNFQQGIKAAMDKLKQLNQAPGQGQMQMQLDQRLKSMGYGGLPGSPDYEKVVRERKKTETEQKTYVADLIKNQEKILKNEERLNKFKEAQLKAGKDIKDTEKVIGEWSDKKLKNEGMLTVATEKRTRTYKELLQTMEREFKMGGMGGLQQAWGGMSGMEKAGMTATSAGAIAGVVAQAVEYMARRPIEIASMQGSAVAGLTGRQFSESRSGEYTYQSMFGGDRKKAADAATKAKKEGEVSDWVKIGAGAAVAAGALLAIPTGGLSMAAGLGVVGAAGVGALATSHGVLDRGKYGAYQAQQYTQDFSTMLDSAHEMDPLRKASIDRLRDTSQRDIGMQRTLGMNDLHYFSKGGYLQGQMGGNFTDQQVVGASQGILGAGGSTAMAGQSSMALKAERGLGLTNANQLLGQISGTQSIPETSRKTLIDIFSRGFDNSKYAEENRKFLQGVTEQIFKGGSTSTESASNIADLMKAAIGGAPTTRNIEAGKSAFEAFQSNATETSGYLGGINISSAMQDKDLSQIKDPAELQALLKLKPNEIDETDEGFINSAKKIGLSGPELAKKLRGRSIDNMKTAMGGRSGTGYDVRGMIGTLNPGMGAAETKSYAQILNMPEGSERDAKIKELFGQNEKKMEGQTGLAGDKMIQASSLNAQNSLSTLSDSINQFAKDALEAAKMLHADMPGLQKAQGDVNTAQAKYDAMTRNPGSSNLDDAWRAKDALDAAKKNAQNKQQQAGIAQ